MASNFERQSDFSLGLGSTVPSNLASKARWLYVILGLVQGDHDTGCAVCHRRAGIRNGPWD